MASVTFGLKQMKPLAHLDDASLVEELAAGLPLILDGADELKAAAEALPSPHRRSSNILRLLAEEESAKILLLIDLLRCPRKRAADRHRLAGQLYDHHARLLCAEICLWRPATFGEVRGYVEQLRQKYYLDGPNDVDYIYLNEITHRREAILYTDRVKWEHGHEWHRAGPPWGVDAPHRSDALTVARALREVGAFRPAGLNAIREVWTTLDLKDETHWQEIHALNVETLNRMKALGPLGPASDAAETRLLEWPMPLYPLELRQAPDNLEDLLLKREAYDPT